MKTVAVQTRKQKERKLLEIFEQMFEKTKEPITIDSFKEDAYDEYKEFYSKGMIQTAFKSMVKQGMIQHVSLKEGKTRPFLFAPLEFSIPYEKREWETEEERETNYFTFIESQKSIKPKEYELFMKMVHTKRHTRMPLFTAMKERSEEYREFLTIIEPYVNYLEKRKSTVIKKRLGTEGGFPQPFEAIGEAMGIGYSHCSQLFFEGMYKIEKMIKQKFRMQNELISQEMIQEYKEMIEENHYPELLLEIAREFEVERCIKAFKAIHAIQELQQGTSKELLHIRESFEKELILALEDKLPKGEFDKFIENGIISALALKN